MIVSLPGPGQNFGQDLRTQMFVEGRLVADSKERLPERRHGG